MYWSKRESCYRKISRFLFKIKYIYTKEHQHVWKLAGSDQWNDVATPYNLINLIRTGFPQEAQCTFKCSTYVGVRLSIIARDVVKLHNFPVYQLLIFGQSGRESYDIVSWKQLFLFVLTSGHNILFLLIQK